MNKKIVLYIRCLAKMVSLLAVFLFALKMLGSFLTICITFTLFKLFFSDTSSEPEYKTVLGTYNESNALKNDIEEEVNLISNLYENLNTLPDKKGTLQLKKLTTIIDNFEEIISYQGSGDKAKVLEYKRAVEQVDEAVQYNLRHYFLVMKSIKPFNKKLMVEKAVYSQNDKNELSQEWSDLCLKQRNRAKDILMQNEQAITQLYVFLTDIVNISFKKMPDYSMHNALENLTQQISQTEQYADEVMLSPYE